MHGNLHLLDTGQANSRGRQIFELTQPFWWRQGRLHGPYGVGIIVPAGYRTDFASVPRFFWRLIPPSGPWNKAAVVHDYLYESLACSRWLADAIFFEIMRESFVPGWKRWVMWLAVRCFGSTHRLREHRRSEPKL